MESSRSFIPSASVLVFSYRPPAEVASASSCETHTHMPHHHPLLHHLLSVCQCWKAPDGQGRGCQPVSLSRLPNLRNRQDVEGTRRGRKYYKVYENKESGLARRPSNRREKCCKNKFNISALRLPKITTPRVNTYTLAQCCHIFSSKKVHSACS